MEDYQQRAIKEKEDLSERRQKLINFMHEDAYTNLSATNQGLLMVQLVAMDNYLDALIRRIELF